MPHLRLILFLPLIICLGCDERETELRQWQRREVEKLQQQSRDNSAASRALVEADAESRRQFVALEQGVQAERKSLTDQYTALDADRKDVAAARERVPLLATALEGTAAVTLGVLALLICWRLLGRLSTDDGSPELEEALILSVAGEADLLADAKPRLQPPPDVPVLAHSTSDPMVADA
ncbi:MAG: hypothetical protein C0483_10425 [Pirellula sp.]|nr:hypothetical protein [Pirellula sp.]